jgi:preprotein translocase subunit YajC
MQGGSNILTSLLPLVVLFAIFYFLVIRPQQKQAKQHKGMIAGLKKGDKIITNGGLICEVVKPEENFIKVSLNNDVIVKISKEYVAKKIDE